MIRRHAVAAVGSALACAAGALGAGPAAAAGSGWPAGSGWTAGVTATADPAPGGLDAAFGTGGVTVVPGIDPDVPATSLTPTAAGLVVIATPAAGEPGAGDAVIHRLRDDGTVDPTFGSTITFPVPWLQPLATLAEPDGSIAILDSGAANGVRESAVVRLDAAGQPEPGFGAGGVVLLRKFSGLTALPAAGGSLQVIGDGRGTRLETVGSTGATASRPPSLRRDVAAVAAPAPGGGTVIAGQSPPFVARLAPDGRLDRSFGGGIVRLPALADYKLDLTAAVVDGAGQVTLGGTLPESEGRSTGPVRIVLVRLDADGRLDRRFGHGGVVSGEAGQLAGLAVGPRDGVLLATDSDPSLLPPQVLAINSSGHAVLRFGYAGSAPLPILTASAPLLDGADVYVGGAASVAGGESEAVAAVRFTGDTLLPDRRGLTVTVAPVRGDVQLRSRMPERAQRLSGPANVELVDPRSAVGGDASELWVPVPAVVRAVRGAVAVSAPGGHATVVGGTFALRHALRHVAALGLSRPSCHARTRLMLTGPFVFTAGHVVAENVSSRARVVIDWRCHGATRVRVLSGRLRRAYYPRQPPWGTITGP